VTLLRQRFFKPEAEMKRSLIINMEEPIPLSHLKPGQRATILRVGGHGPARRRYMEMGFVRGETILVKRVAPLGDPVEYIVKGYNLSLRLADADRILVQTIHEEQGG
jgi:Fe2+ transport system protein FeoA